MLSRLAVVFRLKREYVSSGIRCAIGQCKRYKKAGVKAVDAAREFLSQPSEKNYFEPLTPVLLEPAQTHRYESELLNALKNNQVRNIAITGEYGAGKSSVIRTFVERHPEYTCTFVSLAAFGKDLDKERLGTMASIASQVAVNESNSSHLDQKAAEKKTDSDILTRIEEAIVQQLLYAVPAGQLPKTRLKRITQASLSIIWFRTGFISLLIVSSLRLYVPTVEKLPKIDPVWVVDWLLKIPGWLALIVLGLGCLYMLFSALKLLSLFSIDGLTIKGGKLEAAHHGSVLHKYVDEIIYCFERSKIDVVVIEDLDRFGIHDVFTRLREINFIIKQSPQIKRPVYFIYALRDELFAVGEKTKFFDFIIPVIPVINSENSREKVVQLLSEREFNGGKLGADLDHALIETVSYYIDDMRLIKNIVNEFDMFSSILGSASDSGLKLDSNKLFAIIAIRNLHPGAYADLVKRRGPIYEIIRDFGDWRTQQSKQADDKFQKLREQREERVQEIATDAVELRAYVWYALLKALNLNGATHVQVQHSSTYMLNDFVSDDVFDGIFSQTVQLQMISIDQHGRVYNQSQGSVGTKELLESTSYQKRYDLLQRSIVEIDNEMAEQRTEASRINHQTFRAAAKKSYGEVITEKLKDLDVVSYLMRHGFFDIDYVDYFGYFYEGSLTTEDKNLILGLRRGVSPDVATVVGTPRKVVEKLDTDDLGDGRGIIVGLIEYLSTCPFNENSVSNEFSKLAAILKGGVKGHLNRMAEATEILISGSHSSQFIQAVNNFEPSLFLELLDNADRFESVVSRQALIGAIMDSLEVSQIKQLSSMPYTQLYDAFACLEDVSRLMPGLDAAERGWAWARERPMLFSNLSDSSLLADLKNLIKWGCIDVNQHMLSLICRKIEAAQGVKADHEAAALITYCRLKALDVEGLGDLLFKSPEEFVGVLLSQAGMLEETTDSLTELLWALPEEPDLMEQLFERTVCKFGRLEDAPETLWAKILLSDRVSMRAEAVWTFCDEVIIPSLNDKGCEEMDMDAFAYFIRIHVQQLRGELWKPNSPLNFDLQKYLIHSPTLSNEVLQVLFAEIILDDPAVIEGPLSRERWEMLVSSTFLAYSTEILKSVQAFDAKMVAPYLVARWDAAREQIDISQLPIHLVLNLSKSGRPSLDESMKMWEGIPIEAFDSCEGAVDELARICGLANLRSSEFSPSFVPVLNKLATVEGLAANQRSELLIQCLTSRNWEETASLLSLLPDDGFARLSPSVRRIEVPYSDLNMRLINALQTRGFVQRVAQKDEVITATAKPSEMK